MTKRRVYTARRKSLDAPFRNLMGDGKNEITIASVKDPNERRCCAEVMYYIGSWPHYKQCEAPGKFIEGEYAWCGKHNAAAYDRREAKYQERIAKERADFDAKFERERARGRAIINAEAYRKALEEIANGSNDARGVARRALGLEDAVEETY